MFSHVSVHRAVGVGTHPRMGMSGGGGSVSPHWIHGTWDTTGYGRQAGGPHPTGMLSCLCLSVSVSASVWVSGSVNAPQKMLGNKVVHLL